MRQLFGAITGVVTAAVLVAGCAADGTPAADAAARFETALAHTDGVAACALLAPRTAASLVDSSGLPCPEAVLQQDLPTGGSGPAEVFGRRARVLTGDDTLFLSQFPDGWKVIAAGCRPTRPDEPYDCTVEGG